MRLADCPDEIFALLADATDDPQGLVGIAALALAVPTDPALAAGREQPIFYFGKAADHAHALNALPAGYAVSEASSGLPVLKKQAAS